MSIGSIVLSVCLAVIAVDSQLCQDSNPRVLEHVCNRFCDAIDYKDNFDVLSKRSPLPLKRRPLPLKRRPLPLKRRPLPLKRSPLPLKRAEFYFVDDAEYQPEPLPLKRAEPRLPLKRGEADPAEPRLPLKRDPADPRPLPLKRGWVEPGQPAPLPLKRGSPKLPLKRALWETKRRLPLKKRLGGRSFSFAPVSQRSRIGVWPWMYEILRRGERGSHSIFKREVEAIERKPLPLKKDVTQSNYYNWENRLEWAICECFGICEIHELESYCQC